MANRRRRSKKKRNLGSFLFSRNKKSFGKKKRKSSKPRDVAVAIVAVLVMIGIVGLLVNWGLNSTGSQNTAEVLLEDNFDPVKDYVAVRDKANLGQLEILLAALQNRRLNLEVVPVKLDNYEKIVEISDRILAHADCSELQRVNAATAKLQAFWNKYSVSLGNNLEDPFIAELFFGVAEQYLDDRDPSVSRTAHIAKARGLVGETIRNKFLGSFDSVEFALINLLQKFPDDPVAIENIRAMFMQLRAANSEKSVELAGKMTAITDQSEYRAARKLSRFLKDIVLLYDNGIGNLSKIAFISVDDQDFLGRLNLLNSDLDTGETVVVQLDNAIEYFERSRKYDKAVELSRQILENAAGRTDPDAAALATTIGRNGVKRNSLIQSNWSFEELDASGRAIDPIRFEGRVTLIVFHTQDDNQNRSLLNSIAALNKLMVGRNVQIVLVEVDVDVDGLTMQSDQSTGTNYSTGGISLRTELANPNRYLQQCPTRRFPYLVLIDKNGNVDSINVKLVDVKTRIEYLLSKK